MQLLNIIFKKCFVFSETVEVYTNSFFKTNYFKFKSYLKEQKNVEYID